MTNDLAKLKADTWMLSNTAAAAFWTNETYHLTSAREDLRLLLCGYRDRESMIDLIENAMMDVQDMDVTMTDYAKAVVDLLEKRFTPPTAEKEKDKC